MPVEREDPPKRPHVAVVCRELGGSGSVPSVALRQAHELARHARVTLLSDSFPEQLDPRLNPHLITHPDFHFLRRIAHVPRELAFARAANRCLCELQERGGDVSFVLCHGHALIAMSAARFRARFDVPCGLVAHGDVFSSPPGTYDWLLTKFYEWAIPRGYAQADLVVSLSPHMRERAIACGADPGRIEIIPNGIEPQEIGLDSPMSIDAGAEDEPASEQRPLRILFVGTLARIKGVDVLVRAAKAMKDDATPFALEVIGEGSMRRALEQFVAANDLSREVTMRGRQTRRELGKWYRWADVTCVPSLQDLLPTVVLESLVAGTPVVGSAIGGIPSMVQTEVNGLLVSPGDAHALASALRRLQGRPEFLGELKRASWPSVVPRFSWARNGEDLMRAILKLVGG